LAKSLKILLASSVFLAMRHTLVAGNSPISPAVDSFRVSDKKELFRERFRCAIAQCIRHGFGIEECFGVIWEETQENVDLSFRDQNDLYPELIVWAKRWMMQREGRFSDRHGRASQIMPTMRHG
jgi:hypothetical protein